MNLGAPSMRALLLILGSVLFAGCAPEMERPAPPSPVSLEELAVQVEGAPRGFFLSDRVGGFMTGSIRPGALALDLSWGAQGGEILRGLSLATGPSLEARAVTGGRILPSHLQCSFAGGSELEVEPLENTAGVHALALVVKTGSEAIVPRFPPPPALGRPRPLSANDGLLWSGKAGALVLVGGAPLENGRLVLAPDGVHQLLLCYAPEARQAEAAARELFDKTEALREARHERLAALLERGMLRLSDSLLTSAANWFKLSLDALIVEGEDTMLAPGAPWDGTYDLRAAAQSLTGLEIATAGRDVAPAMLRAAARYQDTLSSSPTYGRLPARITPAGPRYDAADVTAWLIREQYEHIARSADTALVHELYPVALRSIEGAQRRVDRWGLVRHEPSETWYSNAEQASGGRGDRAIEVQTLWYYEQMIGSFLAAFTAQSENSSRWAAAGETTQVAITELFMDTTDMRIVDHLSPDGTPSKEVTANGLFAFELTPSELFRQEMLEALVGELVTSRGISVRRGEATWPWLSGQIVYVLTRYDQQDESYRLTDWVVRRALERDMVGVLPETYLPMPDSGEGIPGGMPVYGPSMGEFLRALYQDYLGIEVDALSQQITLMPKLPSHITDVDATVQVGRSLVRIRYEVRPEASRVILSRIGGEQDLKVGFIWLLRDGNAWRGGSVLSPDGVLRLIFTPEDAIAYRDGSEAELAGKWKLEGFSRRGELSGLRFADASAP